jgi:hypothetical protein
MPKKDKPRWRKTPSSDPIPQLAKAREKRDNRQKVVEKILNKTNQNAANSHH